MPAITRDTTGIAPATAESGSAADMDSVETQFESDADGLVLAQNTTPQRVDGEASAASLPQEAPQVSPSTTTNPVEPQSIEENTDTAVADDTEAAPAREEDTTSVLEPRAPIESPPGRVHFNIIPWGDVYVDGLIEEKVLLNYEIDLPAGTHTYRIENEGDRWQCTMSVGSGEQSRVSVDFTRLIGVTIIAIDAEDSETIGENAVIFVDGRETTYRTPQRIRLSPGVHDVKVSLEGYEFVDIESASSGGCFQQTGPSSMNFDPSFNDGEARIRARLRAVR
jgi:hypothetical protein